MSGLQQFELREHRATELIKAYAKVTDSSKKYKCLISKLYSAVLVKRASKVFSHRATMKGRKMRN